MIAWKKRTKLLLFFLPFLCGGLLFLLRPWLSVLLPFLIPPCPFYSFLHIYCFGCGATRSVLALLRFDLIAAIHQNLLVPLGLLLWLLFEVQLGFALFQKELPLLPKKKACWIVLLVLICVYGILRNFIPAWMPY